MGLFQAAAQDQQNRLGAGDVIKGGLSAAKKAKGKAAMTKARASADEAFKAKRARRSLALDG